MGQPQERAAFAPSVGRNKAASATTQLAFAKNP